jgi:3-deoxy-manno-octulosonate cytidylyltransferase (CMP-KDO synthetase)
MSDARETPPETRAAPSALGIVPARLGSTRLPRKMLLRETGRYLFEHTVANARSCSALERVVLATDSEEIVRAASEVGIEALLTSTEHPSGTDRIHEALAILLERGEGPWDVVVNIQGDEPELPVEDVSRLVALFHEPEVELASLAAPIESREDADDPAIVKVVLDRRGDALYFSRSPIPSRAHPSPSRLSDPPSLEGMMRHIGVYAFRPPALDRFCQLPRGELEQIESLEQLRWLEAGRRIRLITASRLTLGIDTEEHYAAFRARLASSPTP